MAPQVHSEIQAEIHSNIPPSLIPIPIQAKPATK